MHAHTIMMVNENQILLNMFEKYLKSRGFSFLSVKDSTSVLKQIKTCKPDIILLHISENYLKMVNIIKAIRKLSSKIPIIVIAPDINKKYINDLKTYDISDFFVTPLKMKKLEERLRSLISYQMESSPSLLIFSENENIIKNPHLFIPGDVIEKLACKIISRSSTTELVEALKNPQNNIQMILVDATNENQTKTVAHLLKIIMTKFKIPVYFIAERFSQQFQDYLVRLGFINILSRAESSSNDLITTFESVLKYSKNGKENITTQHRRIIIKELKEIKNLPPLPDIYFKVEKLAHDPNATSSDYGEILELDTGITARLLRMSNSVFFGFKRNIKTVKDAVTLMGTSEIVSLVRLACITGHLRVAPEIDAAVKKIWKHSATCAIAAQLIYQKMGDNKNAEIKGNLFISGIIHDIGKIVLWKFFPDIYLPFMNNPHVSFPPRISEEKKYMGISHSEVGKALAEHWQLPEMFINVIAFHHTPMIKSDSELVSIIHVADIVSNIIGKNFIEDQVLFIEIEPEKVGYTIDQIRKLARDLETDIKEKADIVLRMITT